MNVRAYQLQRFSLALKAPLRTAKGEYRTRDGFVLMLQSASHAGFGEATPLEAFGTESLDEALKAVLEACAWVIDHVASDELAELESCLESCPSLAGRPATRNAVETALLDLLARERGVPLRALLSEHSRASVEVNAILPELAPQSLADAGRRAVDEGFTTLKVKVAALPIAEDARRLEALRRAVGDGVRIRVDANGGWSSAEAGENLYRLGAFGLELCEQPVPAHDHDGMAKLRGNVPCRVAADESLQSIPSARALFIGRSPAADVLVLRPTMLGGPLRTVRLGWEARSRGVDCYVASSLDGVVARAASAHVAAALPECGLASGLATGALFENEPATAFAPVRGRIELGEAPGLGFVGRAA